MKQVAWMIVCAALVSLPLRAQDKMTVKFSDNNRPRKLEVDSMQGSVTVRGYNGQDVTIEATGGGGRPARKSKEPPPGMHRIGPSGGDVQATEQNNTIKINVGILSGPVNLLIQVPMQTDVKVSMLNGKELSVEGVSGEVEANNMNGLVSIVNVSGAVMAHSMNGKVVASLDTVAPDRAMSFSTFNGDIDVTLPAAVKANVKLKTDRGDMFTDFEIQVNPSSGSATTTNSGNRTRTRTDRTTTGTINGGGPEIQFTSYNGDIVIHKK